MKKMYFPFKRIIDFILSLIALIIFSPVFLVIAIVIKVQSDGPVLFKQTRMGKDKKPFQILKFRTMRIDTPKEMPTALLKNADQYITKAGKILRKTSLDELPQIINILKGEMSIIGPRPALANQVDILDGREKTGANSILPGLTGLAQVCGRDEIPNDLKVKYDTEYFNNISLGLDIKIFFQTIIKVFKSEGIVEGCREDKAEITKNNTK